MLARYYFLETPANVLVYWGYQDINIQPQLGAIPWLEKATETVVDFFRINRSMIGAVWEKFTGKIDELKSWISGKEEEVCISDCGTFYIIQVDRSGVGYREVSDPGGRLVVPASVVPGWVSPCRDLPAPPVGELVKSTGENILKAYFPWIVGGLGILIILMLFKRRK